MAEVSLAFGATQALDGVDFSLRAGEVHALVGENGAGKSTLMKVLAGVHRPDGGSTTLHGRPWAPADPREALNRGVAMIYQELTVLPHLSVVENVMLGLEERGRLGQLRRGSMHGRALEALRLLGREDLPLDAKVRTLGPADRQVVEIARALARRATVLVMDEPTSSLGSQDVDRLASLIRRLAGDGMAIVYISHFLEEVRRTCDAWTVLRDGRSVATGQVADVTDGELVRHMVGRRLEQVFPPRRGPRGDVMLEVSAVSGVPRPEDASLTLHRGEILGIGGLCGAGRTETLEVVFSLRPARSGEIRVAGARLEPGVTARWRAGVGFLVEDRKTQGLAVTRSLAENITLPSLPRIVRPGLGRLGWIDRPRERRDVGRWIEVLGIQARDPDQRVAELSGGNQQKAALARLLQAEVAVLLLDEPTRGIDVKSKLEVYHLLDGLAREGSAILLVSSYLPELLGLCDRVAVMRRGVLGPARPAEDWSQEELLHEALEAGA